MDNLFEQVANISKAHGYDVLAKYVEELKAEKSLLIYHLKDCTHRMEKARKIIQSESPGFWGVLDTEKANEALKNLKP